MLTAVLRNRFAFGPPLWSTVVLPFAGLEHRMKLISLAEEYLPSERARLAALPPAEAAEEFKKLFGKAYFPIEASYYYDDKVKQITGHIPVRFHGCRASNYEPAYNSLTPGQLLAEVLCPCPFEWYSRLTVLDAFRQRQGLYAIMLKNIPEGGFPLADVVSALDGSPYPGLSVRCRWLFAQTHNVWLDTVDEKMAWDRSNVDRLKQEWPAYLELDKQMKSFDSWLGHETEKRTGEVIRYIRSRIPKTLMEVFHGDENKAPA